MIYVYKKGSSKLFDTWTVKSKDQLSAMELTFKQVNGWGYRFE